MDPDPSSDSEESWEKVVVLYVETNLDTRFVCQVRRDKTFGQHREVLKSHHKVFYPDMGELVIQKFTVKINFSHYPIVDSTLVRTIFKGNGSNFLTMHVETVGSDSLPAEHGAFYSQLLPDNINLFGAGTSAQGEGAIIVSEHGSGKSLATLNLLPDPTAENTNLTPPIDSLKGASIPLEAEKSKVDSDIPVDLSKVGDEGEVRSEMLVTVKPRRKDPVITQKESIFATFKVKKNVSRQMIQPRVGGEGSIANALNGPSVAHVLGTSSSVMAECENPEGIANSNKVVFEEDLIAQSSRNEDGALGLQKEENRQLDGKGEPDISKQNQSSEANESSHLLDLNRPSQGNELKSQSQGIELKSKKRDRIKIRLNRIRHKVDCVETLADDDRRMDQMPKQVGEKASLPAVSGHALFNDPASNSDALITGSEGTKRKKKKTFELESKQSPLKKAAIIEKSVKSSIVHLTESKLELPNEHILLPEGGGRQVRVRKSFQENEGGMINGFQLSADAVDNSTHSDLDGKDSTLNKSTDMEMDNMIVSLLSFQDAKPKQTLKHLAPSLNGYAKGVPKFRDVLDYCPTGELSPLKKKKRKLQLKETEKESASLNIGRQEMLETAVDMEHTVDTSAGKQADCSKRQCKKVKFHQSTFTGSGMLETLQQSEHGSEGHKYISINKDDRTKIENVRDGLIPEMAVDMADSHPRKLKKKKKVKFTDDLEKSSYLTDDEDLYEKAEADVIPKDLVPSSRKHKGNKGKQLAVHAAEEQGKSKTSLLESESPKDHNLPVVGLLAMDSRHHGTLENKLDGASKDTIESITSTGKIKRSRKKRDLDKVTEDAVNRVFQDDMLNIKNLGSPTGRHTHDLVHTKDKDRFTKSSIFTGSITSNMFCVANPLVETFLSYYYEDLPKPCSKSVCSISYGHRVAVA
ncbi:hypothetical protein O6H91_06G038300 [Diphasiastrum complanatum]|uniref:Uncharacterized protein n=1 Tax=Diphasiastrum complanatum TaxID=34168 RepID=A0ACC2DCI4_DIPCM|nr:hypothetical protein O6H91_06G038300 [Diphasiastrum complanatum]